MITRRTVAQRIEGYLNGRVPLDEMVDWAENALLAGELSPRDAALLSQVLGRLGVADVREFGLTWDDCRLFLAQLGYQVHLEVRAIA